MHEDFLTALSGFDEAESALVVPGFEDSGELHEGGNLRGRMFELSGRRGRAVGMKF